MVGLGDETRCDIGMEPDGGHSATYAYRGDKMRHSRTVGGTETVFNWGLGWDMLSEESSAGTLQRTYVGRHGHIDGTDPSTGDYAHYLHDHLGSVRAVYDQSRALLATSAYTPYGGRYAAQAAATTPLGYTGHYWEGATNLYFAPYRHYSPAQARWMSRDPLGMVDGPNVYAYVVGNPVKHSDSTGLAIWLCRRKAEGGIPGYHAYLWDDTPEGNARSCGRNAGSGSAKSFAPRDPQNDTDEAGPDVDECKKVPGSDGREAELMQCCRENANRGVWVPFANDCWNPLKKCIKNSGLSVPDIGGRF